MRQRKSPAAAVQDGRTPHPACPVLHPATRRKLLDIHALSANPRAHRAARVAPDVIERTAPVGSKPGDAGGSVSEAGRQRRETRGTCAINGAGAARTVPVTEHEWPDWGREASRGSLSGTRGKRTWSISEIPAWRSFSEGIQEKGARDSTASHRSGLASVRARAPVALRRHRAHRLLSHRGARPPRTSGHPLRERGFEDQGQAGGARAARLDSASTDELAFHVLEMAQVFEHARDFDVIHTHVGYLAFPLSRLTGAACLHTLHGRLDLPSIYPVFRHFRNEPLVSISHAQRLPFKGLGVTWAATVHHGLPLADYPFSPRGGQYLAFLGRISPEKRPDLAIALAKRVGLPLKIAAKVDPVDRAYFEREIQPLLGHPLIEFVGEIGEEAKASFL